MNNFFSNLPIILIGLAFLFMFASAFVMLMHQPREKQMEALMEFLKWAVFQAEKHLGSGTGQLKLREVYQQAILQFPWVAERLTFEQFSKMVDDALDWMNDQMMKNEKMMEFVNV